jgi:uncharacterized phage-associated protein
MGTIEFKLDPDKTREALAYLVSKSPRGLDKYQLCKLLFLADKYHLIRYGRTITGDRYFAMPYGPVPSRILNQLDLLIDDPEDMPLLASALKVDYSPEIPLLLAANQRLEFDNLSASDLEALDEVYARHGRKEFRDLKTLTHAVFAYRKAWEKRGSKKSSPMSFEDFFEEDPEAVVGVLEEAIEDSQLRNIFPSR